MKMGSFKRSLFVLVFLMLSLLGMFGSAFALSLPDMDKKVSLTLHVTETDPETGKDVALEGVEFRLYRVAEMKADTSFALTGEFAGSHVEVNGLNTADQARNASAILEAYIEKNAIRQSSAGVSDKDGYAVFGQMAPGMFLVLASPTQIGAYLYEFSPVFIALPRMNSTMNGWLYEVTSELKMERQETYFNLSVIKRWEREFGIESHRPEEIEIALLRDGEEILSARLNANNGWQTRFLNLSAAHKWSVLEKKVPAGYYVYYSDLIKGSDGNATVIVSNSYRTPPGNIPQTGLMWWPVPVLGAAGVLLVIAGFVLILRGKKRHE